MRKTLVDQEFFKKQNMNFRDGFQFCNWGRGAEGLAWVPGLSLHGGEAWGAARHVDGKNVGFGMRKIWMLTWASHAPNPDTRLLGSGPCLLTSTLVPRHPRALRAAETQRERNNDLSGLRHWSLSVNQAPCGYEHGPPFTLHSHFIQGLCSLETSDSQVLSCTSQVLHTLQCPLRGADVLQLILIIVCRKAFTECWVPGAHQRERLGWAERQG